MTEQPVSFRQMIGHDKQVRLLQKAMTRGTLGHALLLTGLKGVGKATLARTLAQSLLCLENDREEPCGDCPSCRWFARGQHPDFLEIASERHDITIDQIREVQYSWRIGPVLGKHRAVLIRGAGAMNPYASNALLKTLEEPAPGNFLLLTAEDEGELFPTIVSRCQRIRLSPLPAPLVARNLVQKEGLDNDLAALVSRMCGGSYGRALAMARELQGGEKGLLGWRRYLIEKLQALNKNDIVGLLALARELDSLKDQVVELLDMLKIWFRDLLLCKWRVRRQEYANADLVHLIPRCASAESVEGLFSKLDCLESAKRALLNNGNRQLTLEVMLLSMVRV